ncbi:hypothetical protein ACFFRR_007329 [Megaselia abdita]
MANNIVQLLINFEGKVMALVVKRTMTYECLMKTAISTLCIQEEDNKNLKLIDSNGGFLLTKSLFDHIIKITPVTSMNLLIQTQFERSLAIENKLQPYSRLEAIQLAVPNMNKRKRNCFMRSDEDGNIYVATQVFRQNCFMGALPFETDIPVPKRRRTAVGVKIAKLGKSERSTSTAAPLRRRRLSMCAMNRCFRL